MPADLRSRKRVAMREVISDTATRLFTERGFDQVTVDEIAAAADVGRKTVFNHFSRKEDLFFDRDGDIREILRNVLQRRGPGVTPIEAYRLLAYQLVAEKSPFVGCSLASQRFLETIERSETLKARARAIRDELAQFLAETLAKCVGREASDPDAYLAAHLLLTTWTVARTQAHRIFVKSRNAKKAQTAFLNLIDKSTAGLKAAMAGTPYA
jgi:AcrR family transcriptional regulator